ncbi:MAG: carbohydrate-binding protein, partial [Firmicutes bacterium]|nr:carbohydrate-binding protein [Bacillota bacterium]
KEITENTPNLPYRETPLEGEKASVQLLDVCLGKATLENFIAQMTIDELAELCRGGGPMGHPAGNPGNAAVFAGHNQRLREFFGIPAVSTNDGPSGLRISGMATLCPIGTALACTWNDELVEDLYAGIGREMLRNGVDLLLAPGLNLQRNPLNGRNFEYFSEDPLLNGNMAASMCRGIQSEGVAPTPKHFVANNQETNRARGDSRVSERALRELYLRGFENIVKTAGVPTLMSSYNMVNGVWCPYSFQLQHRILRRQWGFDGLVMTDWWIKRDDETTNAFYDPDFDPGSGEARLGGNAYRVRGRVDLLMPGDQWLGKIPSWNPTDREYDWTETNPATAVRAGLLEIGEIQLVAKNVLKFAMQSARFRIDNGLELHDYGKPAKMFEVTCPSQHMPKLDMIYLDGKPLPNFDPDTPEYVLFARSFDSLPEVTIKVADALKINIQQATSNKPAAAISLQSADGGYAIYRVYWDNRSGMVPHAANPVFARPVDIIVNGKSIPNFHWRIPSYTILVSDTENAMVAAVTPENVSCTITRKGDGFIVRAESDHQAMEYRVKITTDPAQAKLPPLEFYSWIKPPHEHDDVVIPVVNMAKGEATRVMAAADRFYSSHPNQGYMLQVTQPTTDPLTPEGRHVSWLEAGRYVLYNLNVAEEGWYNVRARYASGTSGAAQLSLDLLLDTADVAAAGFKLNPTGGWGEHDKDKPEDWVWSDTQQIYLAKGPQKLTVLSGGGFNLNFLEFVPVTVQ